MILRKEGWRRQVQDFPYVYTVEVMRVAGKQTVRIRLFLRFVLHKKEVELYD